MNVRKTKLSVFLLMKTKLKLNIQNKLKVSWYFTIIKMTQNFNLLKSIITNDWQNAKGAAQHGKLMRNFGSRWIVSKTF